MTVQEAKQLQRGDLVDHVKRMNRYLDQIAELNEMKLEALRKLRRVDNAADSPVYLDSKPFSANCVMFLAKTRTGKTELGWCGWTQSPELYATLQGECVRLRNMRQLATGRRSA